jgi:hypothetical protein
MGYQTLSITNFNFYFVSYGHYKVTYTNEKNGKQYSKITTDMQLIDATRNEDSPKQKDLQRLKKICKDKN